MLCANFSNTQCRLVEEELEKIDPTQLAVIDFGEVNCLDFSCADEIVAKLTG